MAKNHKIAKCPPLRFPQFNDQWKFATISEVCKTSTGSMNTQDKIEGGAYPFYVRSSTIERANKYTYDGIAILTPGDGAIGKVFHYSEGKIAVHQRVYILSDITIGTKYLFYYFADKFYNRVMRLSAKNTVDSVRINMITDMPISLPSLAEQEKIAGFLSLIDERIQSCSETITQMKSLRISFYRTISHQRKREWQNIFLRDILTERKENNSMHYDVYSVSVSRGIVNQIEHLGRSFAAKDTSHYNTVHFGDVVYTKSPTGRFPYGIVKQSRVKSAVAVSPLYGVYIPNNYYIGVVLNNFFESSVRTSNYLAPLIQKGAKNTMNITTQHFLDNKILLPTSSEEQKKMADYLILLDERIEVEEELLKQYEMQKKYLLRQMFI
ncbi:restriction endonuclease S subunit [Porphyromonas gingivalis A7A1-28]|uniref:restriction endonuclease subunit S n=1 Tax=Porphyromonas gingivalis TaxID=837 RepID=UPI0007176BE9|nr:restriction endonuclease subunit S [Porphyromonas gingivalis]ALO29769.1 restriction endonuclease S subunit [Porphyromonas gingivalis A7A1-28]